MSDLDHTYCSSCEKITHTPEIHHCPKPKELLARIEALEALLILNRQTTMKELNMFYEDRLKGILIVAGERHK